MDHMLIDLIFEWVGRTSFLIAIIIIIYKIKKRLMIPRQEAIKIQTDIATIINKYLTVINKHNVTTDQLKADLKQKKIKREEADYKMTLIYQNTKKELFELYKSFEQLKKGDQLDQILIAYLELIQIDIERTEINQQFTKDLYKNNINKKRKALNNIYNQITNYLNSKGLTYENYEYNLRKCYLKNI